MNIFIIPSWYPSASNPIYGTFNQEQVHILAKERPEWSVGVSTWGQGDDRFLLRAADWKSVPKVFKKYKEATNQILPNLSEYFSPAFTWTRKFKKGNIGGIIEANRNNLTRFIDTHGKPDVLSAQASYPAGIIAQKLSEEFQIPYTITARMSPFPFKEFLEGSDQLKTISSALQKAHVLIATSHSLKSRMKHFGLDPVEVVNNPIATDVFVPKSKAESDKLTLLAVGRIEEQKGIDILLKAVSQLNDRNFSLRIGGAGSLLKTYQELAFRLGVQEKVVWLGALNRSEVVAEMQACSFYVLSSRHETFGNVVVEAMACGKPVVATRCGGPEEIVSDQTGYLCEIAAGALSCDIAKMITTYQSFDPGRIRSYVEDRFSPPKWANRLEEVFKLAISRSF